MDELNLEPFTVIQAWSLPEEGGNWESMLGEYLQRIAQRCADSGKCVIGHIKAFATLADHDYLRISVVAPNIPASIEGKVPPHCTNLELTLNVLVYGLERSMIEKITLETAGEIARKKEAEVHYKYSSHAGEHLHHSHHHQPKGETA